MSYGGPDLDSEIPRVNLDDYRDLPEIKRNEALEDMDAGHLVELEADGVSLYGNDGVVPPMVLQVVDARQRGQEAGDTLPAGVEVQMVRSEGGYVNLPLAAGEAVTAFDDYVTPAAGGEVRAGAVDAEGAPTEGVLATPMESIDNSGGDEYTFVASEVHF